MEAQIKKIHKSKNGFSVIFTYQLDAASPEQTETLEFNEDVLSIDIMNTIRSFLETKEDNIEKIKELRRDLVGMIITLP